MEWTRRKNVSESVFSPTRKMSVRTGMKAWSKGIDRAFRCHSRGSDMRVMRFEL